ncbi:MAG: hypothetical protein U0168_26465 [Nannocystaceae bacterium]
MARATQGLGRRGRLVAHQQCAQDVVGDRRPRVELPTSLTQANDFYAACTFDSLADGGAIDDPRPLFVLLEHLEGSPPRIESIRLAGGVATIGVGADLDRVVVTARSLGGAYLPHARSERGSKEQSSTPAPAAAARCWWCCRCARAARSSS